MSEHVGAWNMWKNGQISFEEYQDLVNETQDTRPAPFPLSVSDILILFWTSLSLIGVMLSLVRMAFVTGSVYPDQAVLAVSIILLFMSGSAWFHRGSES